MQHAWERKGMHIGSWWESHKKRDHLDDPDIGGRIILNVF
jgi:hypothetical protein